MKIVIGSDHAGFELKEAIKEALRKEGIEIEDVGAESFDETDDYPDFAKALCEKISEEKARGILICGTGQGMAIAANKFPGVRASVCWNEPTVQTAAKHNHANVICLGGRTIPKEKGVGLAKLWLDLGPSEEPRHARRVRKIQEIEKRFLG